MNLSIIPDGGYKNNALVFENTLNFSYFDIYHPRWRTYDLNSAQFHYVVGGISMLMLPLSMVGNACVIGFLAR